MAAHIVLNGVQSTQLVDGKARINFTDLAGDVFAVDVPLDQISLLIPLLAQVAKAGQGDPETKLAYPVDWWEVGDVPGEPLLAFTFKSNAQFEMTYSLHRDAAKNFYEVLGSVLGIVQPETPGGKPN